MCVIANERCDLVTVYFWQPELTRAIIVHEFLILLRSDFVIFSSEHCSLYTLSKGLLIKYAGLLSDELESYSRFLGTWEEMYMNIWSLLMLTKMVESYLHVFFPNMDWVADSSLCLMTHYLGAESILSNNYWINCCLKVMVRPVKSLWKPVELLLRLIEPLTLGRIDGVRPHSVFHLFLLH